MPAQTVIKVRRDSAANWTFADPTLASGEIGFETDTNQIKIGNGVDEWTLLDYASGGASVEISETAPADPDAGNVWFNSTDGTAYIYYDNAWVSLNPGIAGPQGPSGVTASTTAPVDTGVLWVDTDEEPDVPVPAGGATGQVLAKVSATDYDTAWVPQNLRVFSNSTTRASAIPTPTDGMTTYLQSTDLLETWNGTAWASPTPAIPAAVTPGLVFITAYPIGTAVASVTVPDVFSSTYDHYRVQVQGSSNTTNGTRLRLQFSGSTSGTQYYGGGIQTLFSSGAVSSNWDNNVARFNNIGNNSEMYVDIFNPFLTRSTRVAAAFFTTVAAGHYGGYILDGNSSTGFTISVEGGTMTGGTIAVYGYRKA
jgi:hypothetical protein